MVAGTVGAMFCFLGPRRLGDHLGVDGHRLTLRRGDLDPLGCRLANDLLVQLAHHQLHREPRQAVVQRIDLVPVDLDRRLLALAQLLLGVRRRHDDELHILVPQAGQGGLLVGADLLDLHPALRHALVEAGVTRHAAVRRQHDVGRERAARTGIADSEQQHHEQRA